MKCLECGCYRGVGDFYHGDEECYHCMYKRKLRDSKGLKSKRCCVCNKRIEGSKKYCGRECIKKNYWMSRMDANRLKPTGTFGDTFSCSDLT